MAAPTTIGIDPIAVQEQMNSNVKSLNSTSTFDSILNTASYASGVFGPVAAESVYATSGSDSSAASIVTAAVNAASGGTASYLTSSTYGSGYSSSSLGTSGSTNYLTGGSSALYSDSGDTSVSGNVEDIMNESYANQAYLIAVQSEMGNISTQTNAISNAINVKTSTERQVISNWKS